MTYVAAQARRQLLDTVAEATRALADALASLAEAYEALDEDSADRLEQQLFRPVQTGFARAQRAHGGFAGRIGVPSETFGPGKAGGVSTSARGHLEAALEAVAEMELILTELQDSMLPVEVGDRELRTALAELRTGLAEVPGRGERFLSLMGR